MAGLACLLPAPAWGSTLRQRLSAALAGYHGAGTGAIAVDLTTGKAVFAHNARASLLPASNEKLALTYAALVVLGPTFRMRTELLGEGHLRDGVVWDGDLVLRGFGDPTLDREGLLALARDLRESGIRRVTGGLIADESYFDVRRSAPGGSATSSPGNRARFRRCRSAAPIRSRRRGRCARRCAPRGSAYKARPGARGQAAGRSRCGTRRRSPEILRQMDVESDNHTAELVLKQLGAVAGQAGSTAAGAAIVRAVLAEHAVPLGGVRIADGSGLSSLDRMTPKALVTILQHAWSDPDIGPVLAGCLAVAGREGTLRHRMRAAPARGNVRAKTGTLTNASALSGYVRNRYAFAILQNGSRLGSAHEAQDRFAEVLAAQ